MMKYMSNRILGSFATNSHNLCQKKSKNFMILMKGTCAQNIILESQISNLIALTPLAGIFKD